MKIQFNINYKTQFGQFLKVVGNVSKLGSYNVKNAKPMLLKNGEKGDWNLTIDVPEDGEIKYKYVLCDEFNSISFKEFGDYRNLNIQKLENKAIMVHDYWKSATDEKNVLFSSAFTQAVFKPQNLDKSKFKSLKVVANKQVVQFNLRLSRVSPNHKVGVIIGSKKDEKLTLLNNKNYPMWSKEISISKSKFPTKYRYCIYDEKQKKIVVEEYIFRELLLSEGFKNLDNYKFINNDEDFKFPRYPWKGGGVAIPVFSLRTKKSLGVGEFDDIKLLVDWAKKTGLKLVQILPINDTTVSYRWTDSYPYAAISVFALHPIYINLEKIGKLNSNLINEITNEQKEFLNKKDFVDYEKVMKVKTRFLKQIFAEQKVKFFKDPEFKKYFTDNKDWLVPYATFSFLRDLYGTADFDKWGRFKNPTQLIYDELNNSKSEYYNDIAIHYFVQFHLHKQLLEAANYARQNGIILKGDIPIGIFRNSVDAWTNPELYNLDSQAGAPPDDFAENGQNWKFPTYNWDVMAQNNYRWWKKRLTKLSAYFDAYRIDHILGFFRIWEIPQTQTQGIMGRFNPAIALDINELKDKNFGFDLFRHCRPYIREHILDNLFGYWKDTVKQGFLVEYSKGQFYLKEEYNTQAKIEQNILTNIQVPPSERNINKVIKKGLTYLVSEVLFLEEDGSKGTKFHPRHSLSKTNSFNELDENSKHKILEIYNDYFYYRNEDFWKEEAMKKLPELKETTDMLVCGEDLGMVPTCVPEVMSNLNMLSLEVQRMPKNPKIEFGHPINYPYLSVATPSSHDTSTIREWWEEDTSRTQRYYNQILGKQGGSPFFCEPWVAEEIINQHNYSPSIWAIFPIQDLLAMNSKLRRQNPKDERINVPANPEHFWKYRLHLNLEDLIKEIDFNNLIKEMMRKSGRLTDY